MPSPNFSAHGAVLYTPAVARDSAADRGRRQAGLSARMPIG